MWSDSKRDWWRSRRVALPLGASLMLAGAVWAAVARSRAARIVVYNETGNAFSEMTVEACGISRPFRDVNDGDSVRLKLSGPAGAGEIVVATNGVVMWKGGLIEARSGQRVILRLRRDGEVESTHTASCWQALVLGVTGSEE